MEAMGIIFSNIYDSKMGNLTWERTSGSIPFGGRYRQIDFVLSNMSNSGIRNSGIITKYNYQSLMDHLANCEDWDRIWAKTCDFCRRTQQDTRARTAESSRRCKRRCRF